MTDKPVVVQPRRTQCDLCLSSYHRWIPLTTVDRHSMNKWCPPIPTGTRKCKLKRRLGVDGG